MTNPLPASPAVDAGLFVACLCAEWCGACREYRAVFEAQAGTAGPSERYAWIDIEDQAEVLGDFDIETFPTLLIGDAAGRLLFFGTVTPHAQTLARLVENARRGDFKSVDDAGLVALAARARALA
ncbi:MAG: thioredoxin family protein [Caldimonas sp.]